MSPYPIVTADSDKPPLLVLAGPTAIGKTGLSIEVAKRYHCEIISGDSMQVYRGMDVGTAKIMKSEMQGIPHHMIDICDPSHPFSVAEFQERARTLIGEILDRGALPFIVGGTGLYIESVCYNYQFSQVGSDDDFRQEQQQYYKENGANALHDKLRQVDPASADKLHPHDVRRVIRALEIAHLTDRTMTEQLHHQPEESPYTLCIIGLTTKREILYNRIEERIDHMLEAGLQAEVQELMDKGIKRGDISMQGLGYKEMAAHLAGEVDYDEMVRLLKRNTRRFAKRQLSRFRRIEDMMWLDIEDIENISLFMHKFHAIVAGKLPLGKEY